MPSIETRNDPEASNQFSRNFLSTLSPEVQTQVLRELWVKDINHPDLAKKVQEYQSRHKDHLSVDGKFGRDSLRFMLKKEVVTSSKKELKQLKKEVAIGQEIERPEKTFKYSNGAKVIWTGEDASAWKNQLPHGDNITFIEPNGAKYVGSFRDGKQHGPGEFTDSKGNTFEGEWVNGKLQKWASRRKGGMSYEGEMSDFNTNGRGKQFDTAGRLVYDGEWKNGKREGEGTLHFQDGRMYKGHFSNNKFNGKGTLYDADGTVRMTGHWKNSMFIW